VHRANAEVWKTGRWRLSASVALLFSFAAAGAARSLEPERVAENSDENHGANQACGNPNVVVVEPLRDTLRYVTRSTLRAPTAVLCEHSSTNKHAIGSGFSQQSPLRLAAMYAAQSAQPNDIER
jgi:hypothetical protein